MMLPDRPRSYLTPAVLTMVLYCLLYIPGLIANVAYLSSARAEKRRSAASPEGYGCLWALLVVLGLFPVWIVVLLVLGVVIPVLTGVR